MTDIAELLLDAPTGIKLYCPIWGEVVFQGISDDINVVTDKGVFDGYGRKDANGECLLFPSRKRHDWKEWQKDLLKPNDVVSCDEGVFLYAGTVHYNVLSTYNMVAADGKQLLLPVENCLYATTREAEKFFKAMRSNGLQWNAMLKKAERMQAEQDKPNGKENFTGEKAGNGKKKKEMDALPPGPGMPTEKGGNQPPADPAAPPGQGENNHEQEEDGDGKTGEWARFLELVEVYKKEGKLGGKKNVQVSLSLSVKCTFEHVRLAGLNAPTKSIVSAALHAFLENNAGEVLRMGAPGLKSQGDFLAMLGGGRNETDNNRLRTT